MKKYIVIYLVLLMFLLGLGVTHGIPYGVVISQRDFTGWFITGNKRNVLLVYNVAIILSCYVIAFVQTLNKDNLLKFKWLSLLVMFMCIVFLPLGMSEEMRGIGNEYNKEFWSLIKLVIRNI